MAERCFAGGGRWIAAAVLISTFGTTNSIILATARAYFSMARMNVFPCALGMVHPRFHTPAASLIMQGIWSALLNPRGLVTAANRDGSRSVELDAALPRSPEAEMALAIPGNWCIMIAPNYYYK
jgi:amino acid transporter